MKRQLVPDYILSIKPYQAGKPIEELAREKGLSKISKLASNENPLGPSPKAIEFITKSLHDIHRYPDSHAFALKSALSQKFKLKKENIILGSGSESIMGHIARAFIQTGDEVLTSEKTFITFFILARTSGAKITTVPMKNFRYDVEALTNKINEHTKIIYVANPDNPSGSYITKQEFEFLMSRVPSHVLVILDEAYYEFAHHHPHYPDSMNYRFDNVITLRTFSKAYGISGLRVGYGFGHEDLIGHLHKVKLPFEPSLPAQSGALGALEDTLHLKKTLENNQRQYDRTWQYLKSHDLEVIPSATNFLTVHTGSQEKSIWLYENLLNHGVIIRPLVTNLMPECVRISLGNDQEMNHFFSAMDEILPEFKKLK